MPPIEGPGASGLGAFLGSPLRARQKTPTIPPVGMPKTPRFVSATGFPSGLDDAVRYFNGLEARGLGGPGEIYGIAYAHEMLWAVGAGGIRWFDGEHWRGATEAGGDSFLVTFGVSKVGDFVYFMTSEENANPSNGVRSRLARFDPATFQFTWSGTNFGDESHDMRCDVYDSGGVPQTVPFQLAPPDQNSAGTKMSVTQDGASVFFVGGKETSPFRQYNQCVTDEAHSGVLDPRTVFRGNEAYAYSLTDNINDGLDWRNQRGGTLHGCVWQGDFCIGGTYFSGDSPAPSFTGPLRYSGTTFSLVVETAKAPMGLADGGDWLLIAGPGATVDAYTVPADTMVVAYTPGCQVDVGSFAIDTGAPETNTFTITSDGDVVDYTPSVFDDQLSATVALLRAANASALPGFEGLHFAHDTNTDEIRVATTRASLTRTITFSVAGPGAGTVVDFTPAPADEKAIPFQDGGQDLTFTNSDWDLISIPTDDDFPTIAAAADEEIVAGSTYTHQVQTIVGDPATRWILSTSIAPYDPPPELSISASGLVTFSPVTALSSNPFRVYVYAANAGGFSWTSWDLTVVEFAPIINDVPDKGHLEFGAGYSEQLTLAQGDGTITWELVTAPGGSNVSPTGLFTWAARTPGVHPITVRATNVAGSDDESWNLTVTIAAPQLPSIPNETFSISGDGFDFGYFKTITLAFSYGETVQLLQGPAGMTAELSSETAVSVVWSVENGATPGVYTIEVQVSNAGGSDAETWELTLTA